MDIDGVTLFIPDLSSLDSIFIINSGKVILCEIDRRLTAISRGNHGKIFRLGRIANRVNIDIHLPHNRACTIGYAVGELAHLCTSCVVIRRIVLQSSQFSRAELLAVLHNRTIRFHNFAYARQASYSDR